MLRLANTTSRPRHKEALRGAAASGLTGHAYSSDGWLRALRTALVVLLAAAMIACSKGTGPEQVADAFVDAYFRQMDQEKAKEYTALGATKMLDDELREVGPLRKEGYTPSEAAGAEVDIRRGEITQRDQRVRVEYEITLKADGAQQAKVADVELTQIQGAWKVVRVGLKAR